MEEVPPGHQIWNTVDPSKTQKVVLGSDSSLHFQDKMDAAAWIVTHNENEHVFVCVLMSELEISSLSSYCTEMEGTFCKILHMEYIEMTPEEAHHWCDNEQSLTNFNKEEL